MNISAKNKSNYEIVIQPNRSWLYIDWEDLFHYKDLLLFLVKRDFISKYRQSILGPAWYVFQPLLTTVVFTVVFGKMAKIPTDKTPPLVFYLCGLSIWNYFANCLNLISNTFITNVRLFSKVYFPRLIVPLSITVSNLVTFLIQFATFLGFYFYFKYFTPAGLIIKPNWLIVILPLLLLETAIFSLGVGLIAASLTAKYRDLMFLIGLLIQLWMYVTPIIYPISTIPDKWRFIMFINPMAPIVEIFKFAFLGVGVVRLSYLSTSVVVTIFIFLTGLFLFNKTERTVTDTI